MVATDAIVERQIPACTYRLLNVSRAKKEINSVASIDMGRRGVDAMMATNDIAQLACSNQTVHFHVVETCVGVYSQEDITFFHAPLS